MRLTSCSSLLLLITFASAMWASLGAQTPSPTALPNRADSFKFAVLGESGTGEPGQYELAEQMAGLREGFNYDTVLLLGGNIHGSERPQDFVRKFETPYKPLIDGGVKFYAALGNEDAREQRYYKNFNMNGKLYYTAQPRPDVLLVVLESTYMEKAQLAWLATTLENSTSAWKIVSLHHPPYSSGRRHGSNVTLRNQLEPLFVKHNVGVVLSAHDNIYERTTPQNGITYFVVGSSGKVQQGGIDRSGGITASGFDTDLAFMAAELAHDEMHFTTISRTGQTVDSGVVARRK